MLRKHGKNSKISESAAMPNYWPPITHICTPGVPGKIPDQK